MVVSTFSQLKSVTIRRIILITIISVVVGFLMLYSLYQNQRKTTKILFIGVDGATLDAIIPLIEQGKLPTFEKLIREGSWGNLATDVPVSPPSWTSIATGTKAETHGIYLFGHYENGVYIPTNSSMIKYPVWEILSNRGIRVGVFSWLFTWPPKGVNGFIVPNYWNWRNLQTFPPNIAKEIDANLNGEYKKLKEDVNSEDEFIQKIRLTEEWKTRFFLRLLKRFDPEFSAIVFYGTHVLQHRYWAYMEPRYFDVREEEVERYGNLIEESLQQLDNNINEILNENENVILIIASDHGMARDDYRSGPIIIRDYENYGNMRHIIFLMNVMLERGKFLTFKDNYMERVEIAIRTDFSRTKAYFCNNLTLTGICINLKGRRPYGIVEKEEYEDLIDDIIAMLRNVKFQNNEKVFIDVRRTSGDLDIIFDINSIIKIKENIVLKEEEETPSMPIDYILSNGEKLDEILINDISYDLRNKSSMVQFIDFFRPGGHTRNGTIIVWGKNIKNSVIENASVIDIAPTILYLMGEEIPASMEGRALREVSINIHDEKNSV